jgi:RimJ/RimL family protein N-acetyltransferase
VDVPTLRTERLVLMPLGSADLDEAAALYSDESVMRYVDGGTRDRPATAHLLEANERCWKSEGWGFWAVRNADTGAFIGACGFHRLTDVQGATVEFSCTLSRRNWGQGLAAEAGNAVLYDGWERLKDDLIHAVVPHDNRAGSKMIRKLGFRRGEDQLIHGEEQQVWQSQRLS